MNIKGIKVHVSSYSYRFDGLWVDTISAGKAEEAIVISEDGNVHCVLIDAIKVIDKSITEEIE